jgi:hypothetical protein
MGKGQSLDHSRRTLPAISAPRHPKITPLHGIRAVNRKPCDARRPAGCSTHAVNVLAVTILVSSCLAAIFVVCFAIESRRARRTSLEHDSLIPFDPPSPKLPKP